MGNMKPCPIKLNILLYPYFQSGVMRWEGNTLVGVTPSGDVELGQHGEWAQILSYLTKRPNPEQW